MRLLAHLVVVSTVCALVVVRDSLGSLELVERGRERNDIALAGDVAAKALNGAGDLVDLGEDDACSS